MKNRISTLFQPRLAFLVVFILCLVAGGLFGLSQPARAQDDTPEPAPTAEVPQQAQPTTAPVYAGASACAECHKEIHDNWQTTRHANAFSSPIFQRDWTKAGSQTACLSCHTTGYDPATGKYAQEGVTCESCHGPFTEGHPLKPMPVKANAELCATCHKNTTDEWKASKHAAAGIVCEACHDQHAQKPKAASVTELCTNCHKDNSATFTHGTHAQAGLECSNCHMYSAPRTESPIGGLVATGHTFSVGSEACIGCHKDTVHSRNEIVKLTGEVNQATTTNINDLEKQVKDQASQISTLKQQNTVGLYTGLAQGAIIGLLMGAVTAWIVSRRIRMVEESEL